SERLAGRGHADVDAHHARFRAFGEYAGRFATRCVDGGGVALGVRIFDGQRLVEVRAPHDRQHGPKDFVLGGFVGRIVHLENARADVGARIVTGGGLVSPVHRRGGPRPLDIARDTLARRGTNHTTEVFTRHEVG